MTYISFENNLKKNLHATVPGKNPPCWKGIAMCCWNMRGLTPGWYMGMPVFPSATATRLYGITWDTGLCWIQRKTFWLELDVRCFIQKIKTNANLRCCHGYSPIIYLLQSDIVFLLADFQIFLDFFLWDNLDFLLLVNAPSQKEIKR